MQKRFTVLFVIIGSAFLLGSLTGGFSCYFLKEQGDFSLYAKAIVQDLQGNRLMIEISDEALWDEILTLFESQDTIYIGGGVEDYSNEWGFHFQKDTIFFPDAVIQLFPICSSIQGISENLDECLGATCYFVCQISELVR